MADIGTFGSNIQAFTPINILPEPNTPISWDLLQAIGQFSQRFLPMATVIATVVHGGTYTFDYSKLGCDYFPPHLEVYIHFLGSVNKDGSVTSWGQVWSRISTSQNIGPGIGWCQFRVVNIGNAKFVNYLGVDSPFLLIAYI